MSKKMVIEIPESCRALGEAFQGVLDRVLAANRAAVGGRAVDYAPLERDLGRLTGAVERGAHQAMLEAVEVDARQVTIEGKTYNRVERCAGDYHTMAGDVSVVRSLYREAGVRNGKTVDAITLRTGAVGDGWLPEVASAMAFLVAQEPSRQAEQAAAKLGRLPYSRSAFEDVAHLLGAHYVPRRKDVEEHLIADYEPPAQARAVSAALDRVSVPMEEPKKRPVGRPKKGAPKRPVDRKFRMAYCGTVTLHDEDGKALHTIRYGLMPGGDPVELVTSLCGDVGKLLEKRPDLACATLADGAHDLWKLLEEWLDEESLGVKVHRLVDLWHVLEKLGKAARIIHGADGADAVVRRWRLALLNRADAPREIALELWRSGRRHVRIDGLRPVHEAIRYLLNHRERMRYRDARRAGLPVGSGAVEATCKTLVETRMKRAGARWKEATGEHVLQLRALELSDRWDEAMALTLAPLRRAVRLVA